LRFYIDSNVIISYINLDFGRNYELMYKRTEDFFSFCKAKKIVLIFSDFTFQELKKKSFYSKEQAIELLSELGLSIEIRETEEKDSSIIKEIIQKIHYPDSVHAFIALSQKCNAIITWNKKDFEPIEGLIKVLTPEEFLESPFF